MNGQRIVPDDIKEGQYLIVRTWREESHGLFGSSPAGWNTSGPLRVVSILIPFIVTHDVLNNCRRVLDTAMAKYEMWHATETFAKEMVGPEGDARRRTMEHVHDGLVHGR